MTDAFWDLWIVVPRWSEFQHYGDRDPTWIKVYTRLTSDDEWLGLTWAERGLLLGIWLEYARANGEIRTRNLRGTLGERVFKRHLERLNDAGFIGFSASKPLAIRYPRVRERDTPLPPSRGEPVENRNGVLSKKARRKLTGCRHVRGSHGFGYVRDPLGADRPPPDWPYDRPTDAEIDAALKTVQEQEANG